MFKFLSFILVSILTIWVIIIIVHYKTTVVNDECASAYGEKYSTQETLIYSDKNGVKKITLVCKKEK